MDLFFENGADCLLSLEEMLAGDIKSEFELGLGLDICPPPDDCGWGDAPSVWAAASLHSSLNLEGDPAARVMVNPNSVMPVISRSSPQVVTDVKKEVKVEIKEEILDDIDEDAIEEEEVKREVEEEAEEEEEEEVEEEDEDDEDEEEEDDAQEEEEVELSVVQGAPPVQELRGNLWSTVMTKPVKGLSEVRQRYHIKSPSVQATLKRIAAQRSGGKPATLVEVVRGRGTPKPLPITGARSVLKYSTGLDEFPKPAYSYSCLIAMALKNSATGSLPVSEIYNFMCEHFPYFKSAPSGWKNSVRHNLSLNKCFEKIEKGSGGSGSQRKGCLWAMNPSKITKMDDEVAKWSRKDPQAIKRAMRYPETLERLERGDMKIGGRGSDAPSEDDTDSETESSQDEEDEEEEDPGSEDEGEVPPSLKPFDSRLNSTRIISDNNLTTDLGVEFSEEMYEELGLLQQVLSDDPEIDLFVTTPTKRPRLECVVSPLQRRIITSHQ